MRRRLVALLLPLGLSPAAAQEQPPIALTSDTVEYCAQLARQVADHHSTLPEIGHLLDEGRDLCEQGEVRHGIRQLRRALVMLHRKRTVVREEEPGKKPQ